jgi:hypothetical protein
MKILQGSIFVLLLINSSFLFCRSYKVKIYNWRKNEIDFTLKIKRDSDWSQKWLSRKVPPLKNKDTPGFGEIETNWCPEYIQFTQGVIEGKKTIEFGSSCKDHNIVVDGKSTREF